MRLLRLAEVPTSERDRVFRYSRAWALLLACAVIGAAAALALQGWRAGSRLAYYAAAVLLLGLVLMRRFILARFRPSNWLARLTDDGLFIQLRSYLNHHFSDQDLTVVFVPYREIRSVRLVRERRDIPYRDEPGARLARVSRHRRRLVEFELAGDPAPLAQALVNEAMRPAPRERRWYGAATTRYKHHPVRMASPGVLQLEWNVAPSAKMLLDALRRYTDVGTPVEVSRDYAYLEGLSREEQERRLLELAETGQTIAAIHLASELYSYDLTQARAFIEDLRSRKARSSPGT